MRTVDSQTWRLADALGKRRERLLDVPQPEELLAQVIAQAHEASTKALTQLTWQESHDCPGYSRLVAQIPLSEKIFDQFFNGRSGYRAQYYLSPEEGILFNRSLLAGLEPALNLAYSKCPLNVDFALVEKSLRAPHSKIWLFSEKEAFDTADNYCLNPPRWVENEATRGRKAPLPVHPMIDIKGAFIHPVTGELFIDECKIDRACDLFRRGYT